MLHQLFRQIVSIYREKQLRQLHLELDRLAILGAFFECDRGAYIKNELGVPEKIVVGHHCRLYGGLVCKATGKIEIGDYSTIQNGVSIQCLQRITIGSFTGIASGVLITDNNTHQTGVEEWIRHRIRTAPGGLGYPGLGNGWELSESQPVVIGDGVWVGSNCTILKGVEVGDGAIIARGSIVTKNVPAFTIVAGNPAKIVKELPHPEKNVKEIAVSILREGL